MSPCKGSTLQLLIHIRVLQLLVFSVKYVCFCGVLWSGFFPSVSLAAGEILQHFMLLLYLAVLPVVLYTSLSLHSVCVGAERGRSSLLHCPGLTDIVLIVSEKR